VFSFSPFTTTEEEEKNCFLFVCLTRKPTTTDCRRIGFQTNEAHLNSLSYLFLENLTKLKKIVSVKKESGGSF
jgi:hypothetical protein